MPTTTKPTSADSKPLPLGDTLHDLAVLRASDIDLVAFLPPSSDHTHSVPKENPQQKQISAAGDSDDPSLNGELERDRWVEKSFEYVREGRAAIRLLHRGDVDRQGARVDGVRGELEEMLSGLGEGG